MARLMGIMVALIMALSAGPAPAQNPFEAAATVNGRAVTNFQVQQRALFLSLLGAPGGDPVSARQALIDEVLQREAARVAGVEVTPEEVDDALVEFAGRANLTPEEFITALEGAGVAPETFRDFVRNGIYWRALIQQRFGPRARPTQAEVTRAAARGGSGTGGVRVLLSEIALPITPENTEQVQALAQRLSDTVSGQAAFERAARANSRAPSAQRGGRIDWVPLANLAPPIAAQVLSLAPGEVSDPINLGSFIALFLLRDLDESGVTAPEDLSVDYAEFLIAGGRSADALRRAARLRDDVDTCDDLYGMAQGLPEEVLSREVLPIAELPDDLRQEIAKLDENEVSTLLTRGGNLRFIMLCARVAEPPEGGFEAIGQQLLNERLTNYAQNFLEELRADAVIVDG